MQKEIVRLEGEQPSDRPLSKAVKAGGFVFVSGTPPLNPESGEFVQGNIEAQTVQVLENIKTVLAAAGSSLDKVVKATVFCTNVGHYRRVNTVYAQYFPVDPPARTYVAMGSWPEPFDIEIECIAIC
jgi:2-iminobutanoate/2-iminopropanoate deaminase